MADMIDASEAKKILGCDDEALNNHINSGAIRAQRVGSKLMLNQADVEKLGKEDDGTIVLTGDSDNLSIDLGKVVDDTSETMVQSKKNDGSADSITFGDELEVVKFDDGNTKDLDFDNKNTTDLNFTDSNTAVMTAVDETGVGATTAGLDFQTDPAGGGPSEATRGASESRRSVRSARARIEAPPVHWIWPTLMAVALLALCMLAVPYYFLAMWPQESRDAANGTWRGVTDSGWTSLASGAAGFSVEPNKTTYGKYNDGASYVDISTVDPSAKWTSASLRKLDDVIMSKVADDGARVTSASGKDYAIVKGATENDADRVDLGGK